MDGCGFIVSLALWVWVESGKGLLVEEAWLVRVPGDKGAVLLPTDPPGFLFPRREGWSLVDLYLEPLPTLGLSS